MEYHSKNVQKALKKAAQDDVQGFKDLLRQDASDLSKGSAEFENDMKILKLSKL